VSQDDRMSLIELSNEHKAAWAMQELGRSGATFSERVEARKVIGEITKQADANQGAVTDLAAAVRLLNDARTTIIDTDLRREWEAERARLRAAVEGSNP
jgi:hypothetical protein